MHTDNRNLTSLQAGVLTLDQLPTSARTFDVCMAAVQLDGSNIEHVSWDTLSATPEQIKRLCMCAIQQDKYAIDHIPDKFKDADIYLKKVSTNGCYLSNVPQEKRDSRVIWAAVCSIGTAFRMLEEVEKSRELMFVASCTEGWDLELERASPREQMLLWGLLVNPEFRFDIQRVACLVEKGLCTPDVICLYIRYIREYDRSFGLAIGTIPYNIWQALGIEKAWLDALDLHQDLRDQASYKPIDKKLKENVLRIESNTVRYFIANSAFMLRVLTKMQDAKVAFLPKRMLGFFNHYKERHRYIAIDELIRDGVNKGRVESLLEYYCALRYTEAHLHRFFHGRVGLDNSKNIVSFLKNKAP